MKPGARFFRRMAAAFLLLGAAAGAGLHHQEDLAGLSGASAERVLSGHSPLSRATHWHSAVVVKDDPCLACQGQRFAGTTIELRGEAPHAFALFRAPGSPVSPDAAGFDAHGSRAPPALL